MVLNPELTLEDELKKILVLKRPRVFTAAEARAFGIVGEEFEEDWFVKFSPDTAKESGFSVSYVTPEKFEIFEDDTLITPEGKKFTIDEYNEWITQQGLEAQEAADISAVAQFEGLLGAVDLSYIAPQAYKKATPEESAAESFARWIDEKPEEFISAMATYGRLPASEALLKAVAPELTEDEIRNVFGQIPSTGVEIELGPPEALQRAFIRPDKVIEVEGVPFGTYDERTGRVEPYDRIATGYGTVALTPEGAIWTGKAYTPEWYALAEAQLAARPGALQQILPKVGEAFEVAMRPFQTALLAATALTAIGINKLLDEDSRYDTSFEQHSLQLLRENTKKNGLFSGFFGEGVTEAWESYLSTLPLAGRIPMRLSGEWLNPVWFIPVGGTFGLVAQGTVKIPLLGTASRYVAMGARAVELGIAAPIIGPAMLVGKGLGNIGKGLGVKLGEKLLKDSKLFQPFNEVPSTITLLNGLQFNNWGANALVKASGARYVGAPLREVFKAGFGWKVLVKREGDALLDIAGRGGILHGSIMRMGTSTAKLASNMVRSFVYDPVKKFGFNVIKEMASFSPKFEARYNKFMAPQSEHRLAGTLEDIFTHPERYNWVGMEDARAFVAEVNSINKAVLRMAEVEGVAPEHIIEDWIKRVVVDADGVLKSKAGSKAVGALPSYAKHRKFETMFDGMAWMIERYGKSLYHPDPIIGVQAFIEQVYKAIADKRFAEYVAEYGFGETLLERVAQRFPGVIEKAAFTAQEKKNSGALLSLTRRAERGEKLHPSTLRWIDKNFPEYAPLLRRLSKGESPVTKKIVTAVADAEAGVAIKIPNAAKLRAEFEVISIEERLAYRSVISDIAARTGNKDLKRMLKILDDVDANPKFIPDVEPIVPVVPKAEAGAAPRVTGFKVIARMPSGTPNLLQTPEGQLIERIATGKQKGWWKTIIGTTEYVGKTPERVVEIARERGAIIPKTKALVPEQAIPKAEAGMPEAGLQQDIFGFAKPVFPKSQGKVTQISMDDLNKLVTARKEAGLPPPDVIIKPKIEGIKGLEAETSVQAVTYDVPKPMTVAQRKAAFNKLKAEVDAMAEGKTKEYWAARSAKAEAMEAVKPGLEEGYLPQPFAGGKIYDREFIDAFNQFFGREKGLPGMTAVADVAGILRLWKAAMDLSFMAIQGQPAFGLASSYLLTGDIVKGSQLMTAWWKAFGYGIRGAFDLDFIPKYLAKNAGVSKQMIQFGSSFRAIDYFDVLSSKYGLAALSAKAMQKIPFKPFERAEMAFFGSGQMIRTEFWKILGPKALEKGKGFELARSLDLITGISDSAAAGVPLSIRQLEQSFMWFAPNYTRAALTVVADIFRGGYTGAMARRALGGLIVTLPLFYAGVQTAISTLQGKSMEEIFNDVARGFGWEQDPITGEWGWNPSAALLSFQVGNINFGLGGFWYGLMRLAGNIYETAVEVGDRDRIDLVHILKNGTINRDNPFVAWWYNRSSPLTGIGFDLSSGRDFLGYPIEGAAGYASYIASRFEPIWMEQSINPYIPGMARQKEIPEGLLPKILATAGEIFGMRVFPESSWRRFYDEASKLIMFLPEEGFTAISNPERATEQDKTKYQAWKDGKLKWGNLNEFEKQWLLENYTELSDLYTTAQGDMQIRDSSMYKGFFEKLDTERRIYYERGDELWKQFDAGLVDTRELREKWSEAGRNYGTILDAMRDPTRSPEWIPMWEYLDGKAKEDPKYNTFDDIAYATYEAIVFQDFEDSWGEFDWEARDKAIDSYIDQFGLDTYNRIRAKFATEKLKGGLDPRLVKLSDDKDSLGLGYWRIGPRDEDGSLTDEAKETRFQWRIDNPEDDARLAFWGYGGKIQTQEAYDLVAKWSTEFNVPLEDMGLGLPPQSLVPSYFDYNKLSAEFGGSSAEARLYRLENPDFDDWGQENWNWKKIDSPIESLRVSVQYRTQDDEYDALPDNRLIRQAYLLNHKDYAKARRVREAYNLEVPENFITNYVEYYMIDDPRLQKFYLRNHKDYYEKVWLEIQENKPVIFPFLTTLELMEEQGLLEEFLTR